MSDKSMPDTHTSDQFSEEIAALRQIAAALNTSLKVNREQTEQLAQVVQTQLNRLTDSTDATGQALDGVTTRISQVGDSAAEIDRRLRDTAGMVDAAVKDASRSIEDLTESATGRMLRDFRTLVGGVQTAVMGAQAEMLEATDSSREQLSRMVQALDNRVSTHRDRLVASTDAVQRAAAHLQDGGEQMDAAAQRLDDSALHFGTGTDAAVKRIGQSAESMTDRFEEMLHAALSHASSQTDEQLATLATTVAWATRSVSQTAETLSDDLGAVVRSSLRSIQESGGEAHQRLMTAITEAEGRLSNEVERGVAPMVQETTRVAEQSSELAATLGRIESVMQRREEEVALRQEASRRMEAAIADAADLITARTALAREDIDGTSTLAQQVTRQLVQGSDQAEALLGHVTEVTQQLQTVVEKADQSRQALADVIGRADSLNQASPLPDPRRRQTQGPPPSTWAPPTPGA